MPSAATLFPNFNRGSNPAETFAELKRLHRALPRLLGNVALDFYKESFRRQGYINSGFEKWKSRRGNTRTGGAILVETGRLRRSLRLSVSGRVITISTDAPYAEAHNEGAKIPVSPKMKGYFWAQYKKTGNEVWKHMALAKEINSPQRQFMDIPGKPPSPFMLRRFEKLLANALRQIFP